MSDFPIEDGIRTPAGAYGVTMKYPFREMKIGQSFYVSTPEGLLAGDVISQRVRSAATQCARRFNLKFTVRKVKGGVRCWRIE